MTEKTGSSGYNLGKQWLGNSRVTELQLPGIAENLRRVTRNKKRNKHIKQQDTKTENTQRLRKSSWKLAYMIAKIKNLNRMPSE